MRLRKLLDAGAESLRNGRTAEARASFRAALRASPHHAEAHYLLGHAEFLAGQLLEAERHAGLATIADPARPEFRLLLGNILQRQGKLPLAEEKYREALRLDPLSSGAQLNIGNVLAEQGRLEEALAAYDEALRLDAGFLPALLNRAATLLRAGRPEEARRGYAAAVARYPGAFEAQFGLATALRALGERGAALERFERCTELDPGHREALRQSARLQARLGRPERSEASCRRLLELDPLDREARLRLGRLLADAGRNSEALKELLLLRRRETGWPAVHLALAEIYAAAGRFENALAASARALELDPGNLAARMNQAVLAGNLDEHEAALAALERLLPEAPRDPQLLNAIGVQLRSLGRLEESVARHRAALELAPDYAPSHRYLSFALLAAGEFAEGWMQQAWNRGAGRAAAAPGRSSPAPWRGEPLAGKSLRVRSEQGLGDQIMFASMFPDLLAAGARCTFHCHARLERLFRRSFPAAAVVAGARADPAVRPPDYEIAMSGMGEFLRRGLAEFPAHSGYLVADGGRRALWRARLDSLGAGLKVGISWRGGTPNTGGKSRSIALEACRPLLEPQGARFVSLQYGDCLQEIEALRAGGVPLAHWPEAASDMDDCAALLCELDLAISIDTTVIHLAGALGRPVWVLLQANPEWRYGRGGERMPWYPSARLLRQARPGEWAPVIARAAAELAALSARRG